MRLFYFILISSISLCLKSQSNNVPRTCDTPTLPLSYETWVQSLSSNQTPPKYGSSNVQSIFNIPVIVHIIHNNESVNSISATSGNNINAAQVIDQINILNKDFNGLNADTSLIPSVFKPLLGKFQINFCLAVVNPTGGVLAEPGIDRINRVAKGWNSLPYSSNYMTSTVKPNSIWDPTKYFNIWVAPLSSGLLGYATFPNPSGSGLGGLSAPYGSATTDGVVILNTSFGSIGTAQFGQYNKGRTATHEIGHWLGLRHIWGDGTCATDYCNDTPPAQNANYNCPTFPYKLGTCSGNTTGEMTMNYMDYTNDACMYLFTNDQKVRAQLILTNSSMRASLLTSTVCNLSTITDDIGITFVSNPTYSQVTNCTNTLQPVLKLTNYGSTTLTSALFSYNIDGVNTQTMTWIGSAAPSTTFNVTLNTINNITVGAHVFSVNVSAPNGNTDANQMNNNSTQQFVITNNMNVIVTSASVCVGGQATLYANGASTYTWSTGSTASFLTVSPASTTVYTLIAASGGCSVQQTATVTVQSAPTLSLNTYEVCEGVPTILIASGANTYTWNNNQTGSNLTVNLLATDNVTLTGSLGAGCVTTQLFNIAVNPIPTSTLFPTNLTCSSCSDASISATAGNGTGPYSFIWTPGNFNAQVLTDVSAGCYTVLVTDAKGCKSTNSACVSFDTGINEISDVSEYMTVSPNPTKNVLTIHFVKEESKRIVMVDALGKVIKEEVNSALSWTVDLSNYASATYFVKVYTSNRLFVTKILKQD